MISQRNYSVFLSNIKSSYEILKKEARKKSSRDRQYFIKESKYARTHTHTHVHL